jgi:hypothetical protein
MIVSTGLLTGVKGHDGQNWVVLFFGKDGMIEPLEDRDYWSVSVPATRDANGDRPQYLRGLTRPQMYPTLKVGQAFPLSSARPGHALFFADGHMFHDLQTTDSPPLPRAASLLINTHGTSKYEPFFRVLA